jgi:hypothetical protein
MTESRPATLHIGIDMVLNERGVPIAPFIPNAKFEGRLGYGLYAKGDIYL